MNTLLRGFHNGCSDSELNSAQGSRLQLQGGACILISGII